MHVSPPFFHFSFFFFWLSGKKIFVSALIDLIFYFYFDLQLRRKL